MPTLTMPKEIMRKDDELVRVPRKEYEEFSRWRKVKVTERRGNLRRSDPRPRN